MKRIIKAGITCIVLLGICGGSRTEAGPHDSIHSALTPSTSLDHLRLLEQSPFEPSPEVWSQIATSTDPAAPMGLLARGALALEAGEVTAAQRLFEASRQENGGSPYPFYYLARIRLANGDPAGAIQFLREAVLRRRDFVAAYRLLGHAHIEVGAMHQGFTALRTVIALAPGLMQPHLELGRAYLEHGRPEHAMVELQRATELDAQALDALYLLGRAKLNSGFVEDGLAVLERYVELGKDREEEEWRIARARVLLQRFAGGPI